MTDPINPPHPTDPPIVSPEPHAPVRIAASGASSNSTALAQITILSTEAQALLNASLSINTRRTYQRHLQAFDRWRTLHYPNQTLTDALMAEYLTYGYETGLAPATLQLQLAAIQCVVKLRSGIADANQDAAASSDPSSDPGSPVGPLTRRVMAGIRRTGAARGHGQALGIGWTATDQLLRRLARQSSQTSPNRSLPDCFETEEPVGDPARRPHLILRDAAMIAIISDGLLRVSELVAINVADLEAEGANTLTLRRSKSDPNGLGAVVFLSNRTMAQVQDWQEAADIADGPLFRKVSRSGRVGAERLTERSARRILKTRAALVGVATSSHGFRVGSAQDLAKAGASIVEMQLAGRWKDAKMPARYARATEARSGAVSKYRYGTG